MTSKPNEQNQTKKLVTKIEHKSGGDQYQTLEVNGKKVRVMLWHGYYVQVGGYKSPFFFNEIQSRRNQNKSNIIIITGSPGEGKTYFGIRLGEIFDPKFNPEMQIIFTRPALLRVIGEKSPLKRGQVIVIDEAHYGLGSRRWMESVQKDLMDALASVRSRGFIIIIISLHIDMLDKVVRKYVLSFMIHMEDRGKGIVYRLYTPRFAKELYKIRLGTVKLKLPHAEYCEHPSCLTCEYRDRCMTNRAIYERNKKAFVDNASKQAEARAEEREQQAIRIPVKKVVQDLIAEGNNVKITPRGVVDIGWLQSWYEEKYGTPVGRSKSRTIGTRYIYEKSKESQK